MASGGSFVTKIGRGRFLATIVLATVLAAGRQGFAVSKFFIPPAGTPGDYNGNGIVDSPDYDVWRSSFDSTSNLAADGNADGSINAPDYVLWRNNLGASSAAVGNWEDPALWNPAGLPGQFDGAIIHANRTANVSTNTGFIAELRIGDTVTPPGGTLNINAGGKVTTLGEVLMGASNPGFYKEGKLNLNGGSMESFGTVFIAFEAEATETINIAAGSQLLAHQNLFGRFGKAFINQAGGSVDVQNNMTWGEGGDDGGFTNRSEYNLTGGTLNVGSILSIGRSPGEDRPESNGRVNISGGVLTAGDLMFGDFPGEEAILSVTGSAIVRVKQVNYSTSDANTDITGGFIIGSMLNVTTVNISGTDYTQIVSAAGGASAATAIPEPNMGVLIVAAFCAIASGSRHRQLFRRRTNRS